MLARNNHVESAQMESLVVERVRDLSTGLKPRSVKKMSVADLAVVVVVDVVVKRSVVKR